MKTFKDTAYTAARTYPIEDWTLEQRNLLVRRALRTKCLDLAVGRPQITVGELHELLKGWLRRVEGGNLG